MKRLILAVLAFFIYIFGIHKIFHYINRHRLTVLLYHGVDKKINWGIFNYRKKFLLPTNFANQIKYLKNNYNIIPLDKAIDCLKNKRSLSANCLCITFDDGYSNFYDFAYPALKKYEAPAAVFLSVDFIDKQTPLWVDRLEYTMNISQNPAVKSIKDKIIADKNLRQELKSLPDDQKNAKLKKIEKENQTYLTDFSGPKKAYAPLSWDNIKEMEKGGFVSFGPHGLTHPILTKISLTRAQNEILGSKNILAEKLKNPLNIFCYPNGQATDFNEEIKNVLKKNNFGAALTTLKGFNDFHSDLFAIKRINMDKTDNFFQFIAGVSGFKLWLLKICAKK